MRVRLTLAAGLLSLAAASASAQGRMPAVRPAWTVTLGSAPDIVHIDAGHALLAADRELRRVRLSDGAIVASATLPDCDMLHPATSSAGRATRQAGDARLGSASLTISGVRRSSGLLTSRIVLVATAV